MGSWDDFAAFLAGLSGEDLERFSRYAALDLPASPEAVAETLRTFAAENPRTTPSELLAITGAQAGFVGDADFAHRVGAAALDLAATDEERQLAHVCLARTHFQNRRDERELARFEEHCRAAVELGHAGTFCYERLAALYEYRGDVEEAVGLCRRAMERLESVGDTRSAAKFEKRLQRLSRKK